MLPYSLQEIERLKKVISTQQQSLETLFSISNAIASTYELKPLVSKVLELVMPLVDAKEAILWSLEPDKSAKCWEYLDCDKTTCPAYDNVDHRCWSMLDTQCSHTEIGAIKTFEEKLIICSECPVLLDAGLSLKMSIGVESDAIVKELLVGNPICQDLLLQKPNISVFHTFPEADAVKCYQQTTWLEQDSFSEPRLIESKSCFPEKTLKGPRTKIGIGLTTKNQIIGMICLGLQDIHYLSAKDVSLLTNIARIAAIAIENAQLYFLMNKKSRRAEKVCREAHHRIKNNLQSLAGLCFLELHQCSDPRAKGILVDNLMRIKSIAVVHHLLSQSDNSSVEIKALSEKIMEIAIQLSNIDNKILNFSVTGDPVRVSSKKATSVAIILNELVTNSLKHGFKGKLFGRIRIKLTETQDRQAIVSFSDNGNGFAPGFHINKDVNLGLRIVSDIVKEDLEGSIETFSDNGAHVRIVFKM